MKAGPTMTVPGHELRAQERGRLQVDGMTPSRVMHPDDPDDAARALRVCADAGAAVVVIGGGTQRRLGAPPRAYDVAFSTDRLNRLLEYEPADLTCRVQAGMLVGALQEELGKHGQWLPLDPPHPRQATVGGMVAANSSGPGRARYGTVRDWVIGVAVAYPSGAVARAGGKVVKNVAGYDLMKLHTGALGTLGVIVEVNLKVQARPEHARHLAAQFEDMADALACSLELSRGYLQPAVMAILDRRALEACGGAGTQPWTLAVRAEGYRPEVDATIDAVTRAARARGALLVEGAWPPDFWDAVRDWPAPPQASALTFAASVPRTGLSGLLEAAGDTAVIALPAAGVAQFRPEGTDPAGLLRRLRQAAGAQGQVIVSSAPPEAKASMDVWGDPPPGFPLMRALKDALDPQGILNPGRFVGGI